MSDIILVYPPVTLSGRYNEVATGHEVPPQPLIYLGAVLREKGYSVEIIDANAIGWSSKQVVDYVLDKCPICVGVTSPTMLISTAELIFKNIKERNANITTVVGGPHVSAIPLETMQRYADIDIGVAGEGEITIIELMRYLKESKGDLSSIKGIIFRENGQLNITEKRPFIENLDSLPFPAWDLLPDVLKYYQQSVTRLDKLPAVSLTTSRGCPYQCTFCARNVFGNKTRTHSAEYIMKVIRYLIKKYRVKSLCIEDENFVIFRKRLIQLCNKMMKEN